MNEINFEKIRFRKGIRGTDEILEEDKKQIAFYGRSNVGKSSSINTILGRKDLVKSSATPGKTKEINFFEIDEKLLFVDLPGYGYAKISKTEREKLRKMIL
jgi:GTP-binding protein